MKAPLKILHIEDSVQDSNLIGDMLEKGGLSCEIQRVETHSALSQALSQSTFDLILSDGALPHFSGLEALEIAHALKPQIPFVFVSGSIGEERAVQSLQKGATDFVLKHNLSRLLPAVRGALKKGRKEQLAQAMERYLSHKPEFQELGILTQSVANEFRDLMQALKVGVELLRLKSGDPAEVAKIAEIFESAAGRGAELMRELVVLEEKTETQLIPIDTAPQIKKVVETIRAGLPANVTLDVECESELPSIRVDPQQFDFILAKLTLDIAAAMADGGNIRINGKTIDYAWEAFGTLPLNMPMHDTPFVCITVADITSGGQGASEPRSSPPSASSLIGEGIDPGNFKVFELMERHGGFIRKQSKLGEKVSWSLYFPTGNSPRIIPRGEVSSDFGVTEETWA